MPETRRRLKMAGKEKEQPDNDVVFIKEVEAPQSEMEHQREKLRQRWELASVLNFLNVFEPVIQSNLKISAEEMEAGLIEPNDSLAQLHIGLLKGIVPSSKTLNVPNSWMSILSKKLSMWWPWVAEGDFPLTAAKGEEMNRYKELDPTIRLFILKALCEIRADQDDIVSYVNDTIKNGTGLSTFQKEKLGEDGNGTLYWDDGNAVIGHRLYKEVLVFDLKPKVKGKGNKLGIATQWETLATNFEEFRQVLSGFSSSNVQLEVAVGKAVEAKVMPALERLQKKKERELKQRERKERHLNALRTSVITRSGRTRRPVNYKFEEYDRAIKEAIDVAQKKKSAEEQHNECGRKDRDVSVDGSSPAHSRESESDESDINSQKDQQIYYDHNANDDYEGVGDNSNKGLVNEETNRGGHRNNLNCGFQCLDNWLVHGPKASRSSKRPAGTTGVNVLQGVTLTTQHTPSQKPTVNTAVQSDIVPDSENGKSTNDINKRARIFGNSSRSAATDNGDFGS
ncbi:hypothetical protein ACH5RR_041097 [Cinchona calisaya]|uniref:DDT domain-containing protein DDR4 n=1 Tax=Cinchona calisaya TaxID=153742 RepID=A0ABD2XVY9_9GENT